MHLIFEVSNIKKIQYKLQKDNLLKFKEIDFYKVYVFYNCSLVNTLTIILAIKIYLIIQIKNI